jgi:hypothetical protein
MRTLHDLAAEAVAVQDACNPLGISKSYATALDALRAALGAAGLDNGTAAISQHPINKMWASKIHDLASMGWSDTERYGEAYAACRELSVSPALMEAA